MATVGNRQKTVQKDWHYSVQIPMKKGKKKALILGVSRLCLVAEVGFEPHDLRVMSPTSYQAALLRDIRKYWCRKRESNPYDTFVSRDFKSRASANSATPATYISVPCTLLYHLLSFLSIRFSKKLSKVHTFSFKLFLITY